MFVDTHLVIEQLTAALKAYVNDKVGGAMEKLGKKVISCNAMLTVDKNPSIEKNQAIEVVINVKGATLRTKVLTHDMYASIDAAADSVKRKLRKYKEKIIDAHRTGRPEGAGFDDSEIQVPCPVFADHHEQELPDHEILKPRSYAICS
jgi:putative sigma-54 modulation protein